MTDAREKIQKDLSSRDVMKDVDGGWAWIVLTASVFIFSIILGQAFTFNIYFVVFLREFGQSRSYTSWIGSVHFAVNQLSAIGIGFFLLKLGTRGCTIIGGILSAIGYLANGFAFSIPYLMVSYGTVVALGSCLVIFSCLDAVSQYFNRYLYPATGMCMAGGGIGLMLFGFITQWLLDNYGWRGSMILMSGLSLQICVLGALYFPRKVFTVNKSTNRKCSSSTDLSEKKILNQMTRTEAEPAPPNVEQIMTWKERCTDPRVFLLASSGFAQGIGALTMYVIYKDLAIFYGLEHLFSWTLLAIGLGNMTGRLLTGVITKFVAPILLFASVTAVCAAVVMANIFTDRPEVFIMLGALFGYCQGSMASSMPVVIAHMFGRRQIATMFGYTMFYAGIGTLIGSPLAGYITDITGAYDGCLFMSAAFLAVSTILNFILYLVHNQMLKKLNNGVIPLSLSPKELHKTYYNMEVEPSEFGFMKSNESICQKPM